LSSATAHRFEAAASAAAICSHWPIFQGDFAAALAGMEAGDDARPTRGRCSLAPSSVQAVFDLALRDTEPGREGSQSAKSNANSFCASLLRTQPWVRRAILGELKMLGFVISERNVLRWMRKVPRSREMAKRWATSFMNHREPIAAMDFFTQSQNDPERQ
jgi:hypothetical protein